MPFPRLADLRLRAEREQMPLRVTASAPVASGRDAG
jgi:hypothetical protein